MYVLAFAFTPVVFAVSCTAGEGDTDRLELCPAARANASSRGRSLLCPLVSMYEPVGVWLLRDRMDIAEPGRGVGLGLGGASEPDSRSELRSSTKISCVSPDALPCTLALVAAGAPP